MAPARRSGRLSPESVARLTFPTAFRGFDQEFVRGFVVDVIEALRSAEERVAALQRALEAAGGSLTARSLAAVSSVAPEAEGESKAMGFDSPRREDGDRRSAPPSVPSDGARSVPRSVPVQAMDDDALVAELGEEMVRVLVAARQAAADIRAHAEATAGEVLREAEEEAERVRTNAAQFSEEARARAEQVIAVAAATDRERANTILATAHALARDVRAGVDQTAADTPRPAQPARRDIAEANRGDAAVSQRKGSAILAAADAVHRSTQSPAPPAPDGVEHVVTDPPEPG